MLSLPKIATILLPEEYELLPNTSEVFELEFAFYEHKTLSKSEIVQRGAFFKSVDGIPIIPILLEALSYA